MTNPAGLDWLLDDFVDRIPAALRAVVFSVDGLLLGASRDLSQADADHMAAIAAGFASLSRSAGRHFKAGPVRQAVIEMEEAVLLVTDAGQGSCFAVLSSADSDIGMVAYEMAMVVERIGHSLGTQPRPTSTHAR
ncbi:dynein regulation protein LC7 [Catellatospora methionotrophica]|uniref:Dynein regulation protein LC7 n=1 Tax=Catellatospora methionotrophica TaxID=121620 RepID=A0A8J3LJT4_9ACTN|nr:roadblock/LC7 domain-containing protein [Catellatospora methionotrophica]GIG15790.1 dynein regulation protein LC7 [Catellatospora methionotrophica]